MFAVVQKFLTYKNRFNLSSEQPLPINILPCITYSTVTLYEDDHLHTTVKMRFLALIDAEEGHIVVFVKNFYPQFAVFHSENSEEDRW